MVNIEQLNVIILAVKTISHGLDSYISFNINRGTVKTLKNAEYRSIKSHKVIFHAYDSAAYNKMSVDFSDCMFFDG